MDQRRLLLAFALSLLLLFGYQELVVRPYQKKPPPPPVGEQQHAAPPSIPAAAPTAANDALAAPVPEGTLVRVENDVMEAFITPVGGRLADLKLKAYQRSVSDTDPLDLVQTAPVLPVTLDLGSGLSDATVAYRSATKELAVWDGEHGEVVLEGELPSSGIKIEKRFAFTGDGYLFTLTARVSGSKAPSTIGLVLTPIPTDTPQPSTPETAIVLTQSGVVQTSVPELLKQETVQKPALWGGFAAQYFLAAVAPATPPGAAVLTHASGVPLVRVDAPVENGEAKFAVFVGPKDREVLAKAGFGLDRSLDFGWFWFVAIPLLQALRLLHTATGNYGVAIIVLTALVKLATVPLTRATFRNMREMQKIQPQMAKLRERFKDDQMAMQKEMMELYKRHRVNPVSGCLPMLLQLPIFVGLYNALSHAIELRHAPFALWINDLSSPDRLMVLGYGIPVLTLLMGASMFLQTWMSPQQGDPTQQRVMLFMPLIFTFMFINFPAGLVLYWLVNNVLTIGQQYLMMRSA